MSFPDVDPNSISTSSLLSLPGESRRYNRLTLRRALHELKSYDYTHPHLWYSTSEVIRALQLFIASGDQLSESSTYRSAYYLFPTSLREARLLNIFG